MTQNKKQPSKTSSKLARRRERARRQRQSIFWIAAAILTIAVLSGVILWVTRNQSFNAQAGGGEISVQEAYQKYQQGTLLVDVRTQEEWDQGHIPNTLLIPLDELPNRLDELPRGQPIVLVCRSGNRSKQARQVLLDAGFNQVVSVQGGVRAWYDAGYPLDGARP